MAIAVIDNIVSMKIQLRFEKGVTFVEVIVSIAIFAAVVASAGASFVTSIQSKKNIEISRGNYEKAQFSMNLVGKSLRTSSVVDPSTADDLVNEIKIFDYSQDLCIQYRFNTSSHMLESASAFMEDPFTVGNTKKSQCVNKNFDESDFKAMTNVYTAGSFRVVPTIESVAPKNRGMVTISMKVCPNADRCLRSSEYTIIQTTVSLRDYFEI